MDFFAAHGSGMANFKLIQEVMQVLAGSVDIETAPAIGATVTLWLPAVEENYEGSS